MNSGKKQKEELELNLSLLPPRGEPSTFTRMEIDDDDHVDDYEYDYDYDDDEGDDDDDDEEEEEADDDEEEEEADDEESPKRISMSYPSSCVSSENSPNSSKSMILAGCPHCLMYVMLSQDEEPKCPKCRNAVLVDFSNDNSKNKNNGRF